MITATIRSRYRDTRTITRIAENRYTIEGESRYYRCSQDKDGNITMFDFAGGPCIWLGDELEFQLDPEKPGCIVSKIIPQETKEGFAKAIIEVR